MLVSDTVDVPLMNPACRYQADLTLTCHQRTSQVCCWFNLPYISIPPEPDLRFSPQKKVTSNQQRLLTFIGYFAKKPVAIQRFLFNTFPTKKVTPDLQIVSVLKKTWNSSCEPKENPHQCLMVLVISWEINGWHCGGFPLPLGSHGIYIRLTFSASPSI